MSASTRIRPQSLAEFSFSAGAGDEAQRLQQHGDIEAGHVGPVALAYVQDVDQGKGAHRLAQRAAGPAKFGGQVGPGAGDHLPAVTALSSPSDSRMSCASSGWLGPSTQRSNAILKTAIPASAVRLAAGSGTPR